MVLFVVFGGQFVKNLSELFDYNLFDNDNIFNNYISTLEATNLNARRNIKAFRSGI